MRHENQRIRASIYNVIQKHHILRKHHDVLSYNMIHKRNKLVIVSVKKNCLTKLYTVVNETTRKTE